MKRTGLFPYRKQPVMIRWRPEGLTRQSKNHAQEAGEKNADAYAINHPKTNIFARIDGNQRAQEPAFPFQMNDSFRHIRFQSISHAKVIVSIKPCWQGDGLSHCPKITHGLDTKERLSQGQRKENAF
jgi:hypothetical protein